jgi:hypothetical protein
LTAKVFRGGFLTRSHWRSRRAGSRLFNGVEDSDEIGL